MPKVAAIQQRNRSAIQANLDHTIDQIRIAAEKGAQIVCLQELFNSPYPCQSEDHRNFDFAETIPGPTSDLISQVATECHVVVIASLFEKRTAGLYHNTAVVFDSDGIRKGIYRKMHIPDDPNYYEKFYFTPGDLGFQNTNTSQGNIGVCICWDQWFPEAARITALKGAEIIFYPTAIGWLLEEKEEFGSSQTSAWITMLRSHAIANGVFVVAPNRVGIEGNIQFWGNSLICDPNGNLLAQAGDSDEQILIAECDFETIDVVRTHWPFLRDRRIDAYGGLLKRFLDDE